MSYFQAATESETFSSSQGPHQLTLESQAQAEPLSASDTRSKSFLLSHGRSLPAAETDKEAPKLMASKTFKVHYPSSKVTVLVLMK